MRIALLKYVFLSIPLRIREALLRGIELVKGDAFNSFADSSGVGRRVIGRVSGSKPFNSFADSSKTF